MNSPNPMDLYFIRSSRKELRVLNGRKSYVSGLLGSSHSTEMPTYLHHKYPSGGKGDCITELGKGAEKL